MNWNMVMLRGARVPALLLGGGLLLVYMVQSLGKLSSGIAAYTDWVFYAALAASLGACAIFYSRLVRWERGAWHECRHCGGPLGWLQAGRVYYGKQLDDFRRCYNCGQATPEGSH